MFLRLLAFTSKMLALTSAYVTVGVGIIGLYKWNLLPLSLAFILFAGMVSLMFWLSILIGRVQVKPQQIYPSQEELDRQGHE